MLPARLGHEPVSIDPPLLEAAGMNPLPSSARPGVVPNKSRRRGLPRGTMMVAAQDEAQISARRHGRTATLSHLLTAMT